MARLHNQTGTALTADFYKNTWTFEMPDKFSVSAGEFVIVPKAKYDDIIEGLSQLKEHIQSKPDINSDAEIHECIGIIEEGL